MFLITKKGKTEGSSYIQASSSQQFVQQQQNSASRSFQSSFQQQQQQFQQQQFQIQQQYQQQQQQMQQDFQRQQQVHQQHFKQQFSSQQQQQQTVVRQQEKRIEPQFIRPLASFLRFSEGQPARLEVEVYGSPAPVVTWFKDNMIIRDTQETQIVSQQNVHTLRMPEIFTEDSGVYKVLIASPLGRTESVCDVKVEGVVKKSSNLRAHSESPHRRRSRLELEARVEQSSETQFGEQRSLVQQQQQQQQFQTVQSNVQSVQGRSSSYTARPVTEQPQKPQFVKHLQNFTFDQGDVALIQCVAISTPDTDVKWFKNGVLIEQTDNYVMAYDYITGLCTLSIGSATVQDNGQYTCVVSNFAGTESSSSWVVIKGKLHF